MSRRSARLIGRENADRIGLTATALPQAALADGQSQANVLPDPSGHIVAQNTSSKKKEVKSVKRKRGQVDVNVDDSSVVATSRQIKKTKITFDLNMFSKLPPDSGILTTVRFPLTPVISPFS